MRCPVAVLRMLLAALVVGSLMGAPARADFVIAGGSATVAPGGTATVAFTIATAPSTTVFNLADFNLELQISVKTGSSFLQFAGSQSDPAYDHSGYVFSGASFVQDNGLLI